MILTVTLNAAIDRTVAVPELPAWPPAPGRRVAHRRGRQGRERRARPEAPRPPRDRDRPRGRPDGRADPRAPHRGVHPQRLHDDRGRVADQPRDRRPDLGRADRGQRARAGGRARRGRASSSRSSCTSRKGASLCVLAGTLPPGVDPALYARLVGELRRVGVQSLLDTEGEPMRLGLRAEPAIVAPNVEEAEGAVGHEFNDRRRPRARTDQPARDGRARGDHHAARRAASRSSPRTAPATATRLRSSRSSPSRASGPGDCFLAGYAAARYEGASAARVPGLRRCVRRRVDSALRRRHGQRRARPSACCRGSRSARWTCPPGSDSRPRAAHETTVYRAPKARPSGSADECGLGRILLSTPNRSVDA